MVGQVPLSVSSGAVVGVGGGVNNVGLALPHWFLKAPPSTLLGVDEPQPSAGRLTPTT